jgi:hypothetical protein
MSKIQLVEKALQSANEALFQDYCNLYFYWKRYDFITSTGSVIGKEKTRKGTPDSYIPINQDEFIFIEYTTKERLGEARGFFEKLSSDIDHCFDEKKSKIKNSQIKTVVLCFTDKLNASEYDQLRKKCNRYGAEFEAHGIDQLAKAALLYPSLGQLVNIAVDTQQILTPPDFIKEYEKGKLATGLSNKVYFRNAEVKEAFEFLQESNLLIIEGHAGVGKSRLALEILEEFCKKEPSFTPVCISNKGCPIYEDARVYLHKDKDYILFIDDANRATKHFDFLVNLLKEDRTGSIKIIATVRDYAVSIVENSCHDFVYKRIRLTPFTDRQIREILESDDFEIKNRNYSDVIIRIAQGNPRLAIMAAKVAKKKQTLSAFNDVPKLYDSYYNEVVQEINELGDPVFLKVLGIISFFRTIGKDYTNNEEIFTTFKVNEKAFWEKIVTLHQMELVDLFDNEVVKISDQVLGSYFFYKTFIRDGTLDFSDLIKVFYARYQRRFQDVIYPVTNSFGFTHIKEKIDRSLDEAWEHFSNDESLVLKLFSLFWIFKQEKVLAHIGNRIARMPSFIQEEYIFDHKERGFAPKTIDDEYFEILKNFLRHFSNNYPFALDLTFSYLEKQPSQIPEFIQYAKSDLIYDKEGYQNGFLRQTILFDKLISIIYNKRNQKLFRGIFYHIVNTFLLTAFRKSEGLDRDKTFTVYTFPLRDTQDIKSIRKNIWTFLFSQFGPQRTQVLKTIEYYISSANLWTEGTVAFKEKLWTSDSGFLLPFIEKNFDVHDYYECKIAQNYLDELKRLNISFSPSLKHHFRNYKYDLYQKLRQDIINGKNKHDYKNDKRFQGPDGLVDWDAIENLKYQELAAFVTNYNLEGYKKLWKHAMELITIETNRQEWSLKKSLYEISHALINKDVNTFLPLLKFILNEASGFPKDFSHNYCNSLVVLTLQKLENNHRKLYDILNRETSKEILQWKFAFFRHIQEKYVGHYYTKQLLRSVYQTEGFASFFDFDLLSKFHYQPSFFDRLQDALLRRSTAKRNIYTKVASILLKKVDTGKADIFFGRSFISKHLNYFDGNGGMLKKIYLSNYRSSHHYDLKSTELSVLCTIAPEFIIEFLRETYDSEYTSVSEELPIRDFRFVWELGNYVKIVDDLMEFAQQKKTVLADWKHFANNFFVSSTESQVQKRLSYIKSFIEKKAHDKKAIQIIFNVITYSFPEKLLENLRLLLENNRDIEVFRTIQFHQNITYSGSRIPILESIMQFQKQIDDLLSAMPNSDLFIEHRVVVKSRLEDLNNEIKREKRQEFEDFFN